MDLLVKHQLEDDLAIRGMSERTRETYVGAVAALAKHYGRSPDRIGQEEIQRYLLHLLTERKLGKGAVVLLGTLPEGAYGRTLLERIIAHYAQQAGVGLRAGSTPGTIICPRVRQGGKALWIAVNMDGRGGEVNLPRAAKDALTGSQLRPGALKLGRYEWRALEL